MTASKGNELSAADIINRMKKLSGLSSDGDLAKSLQVPRVYPSQWRNRNSVPHELIIAHSIARGWDLTYVFTGKNNPHHGRPLVSIEEPILICVLKLLREQHSIETQDVQKLGSQLATIYNAIAHIAENVSKNTGLSPQAAKDVAVIAACDAFLASETPDIDGLIRNLRTSLAEPTQQGAQ